MLYVCNVEEAAAATGNAASEAVAKLAAAEGAGCVVISAAIEEEIAQLDDAERAEYLEAMGLHEAGLDRLIHEGYRLLGLATYFTAGPKEARAWTIPAGASAPQAAGVIHGDFERGFIRAETIGLRRLRRARRRGRGARGRADARGGQDLPGAGRRRAALPVQRLRRVMAEARFGAVAESLRGVSTATLTTVLLKKGLRNVWMRDARPIRVPQARVVGPAFTLRFVPAREDLATPASWASPVSTRAAIEAMPAGCVAVVDAAGVATPASSATSSAPGWPCAASPAW